MERQTDTANLADFMATKDLNATLRIAVITAVQASAGRRVQTSATETAWIPRSEDTTLTVGDRVWLLQQGSVWIVGGRLSGEPGAVPIGAVVPFANATAPDGWLAADGSAVSRTTYAALFVACGTTYGVGDGSTTFNLPDLRTRVPVGAGTGRALASTGGADTVTLTQAQMPVHTHSAGVGTAAVTVQSGTGASVSNATGATTGNAGSGSAHENMPPFQVLLYCIRAL